MKLVLLKDKKTLIILSLTVLWMGVIFFFSSQPADDSSRLSGWVTAMLLRLLDRLFHGQVPQLLEGVVLNAGYFVRKAGHVIEYLILGVLVSSSMVRSGIKRQFIFSFLISSLYAVTDEIHQMFVPGRGPGVGDVALDSAASLLGVICILRHLNK